MGHHIQLLLRKSKSERRCGEEVQTAVEVVVGAGRENEVAVLLLEVFLAKKSSSRFFSSSSSLAKSIACEEAVVACCDISWVKRFFYVVAFSQVENRERLLRAGRKKEE